MNKDGSNIVRINFDGGSAVKVSDEPSPQEMILCEKKYARFSLWLQQGTVGLVLDARKAGVKVPEQFKGQGDLRLNFCYQFHIPDFGFNQKAVWASLSFPHGEFFCQVPWPAVYAMYSLPSNKGSVWFTDFPADLDQMIVLGFTDETCESIEHEDDGNDALAVSDKCSVISIESLRKKSIINDEC